MSLRPFAGRTIVGAAPSWVDLLLARAPRALHEAAVAEATAAALRAGRVHDPRQWEVRCPKDLAPWRLTASADRVPNGVAATVLRLPGDIGSANAPKPMPCAEDC
mmetsp:Transcript_34857/g.76054  ORF Transcript_34857/g.76054 Transcript_34857/m.76054 type:complete len:105 (+) Transcript_34857:1309-1623(+)